MIPMPSSADLSQHLHAHTGHVLATAVTSALASWSLGFALPDELVSYSLKLFLAFPLGLMTGLGSVVAPILYRKLFKPREGK